MWTPTRTVVGYALLFSVPAGAGLGVAVEMTSGDPALAVLSGASVALVAFLALLGVFSSGSVER